MKTRIFIWAAALLAMTGTARAQWLTQTFELKPGWNAVYTHVDPSYADLQEIVGSDPSNPIDEIWMWRQPLSTAQFVNSPQTPTAAGTQWINWVRPLGPTSPLQQMIGNNAYLVHVSGSASYTWNLKGQPVPPAYEWTTTGLNLLGFPTVAVNPPTYESFLAKEPEFQQSATVFNYPGGPLGAGNPAQLFAFRTKKVVRGEAVWVRAGTLFNRYFAPFEVTLQNRNGVHFGDKTGQYKMRVKNLTGEPLIVRLQLESSESAPAGQTPVAGTRAILVRGELNPTNITYGFSVLTGTPQEWTLAAEGQPGSEKEIVVGVNRAAMGGDAGDLFAGVLRFTDGLGFAQVDLPASAVQPSKAGLWVGSAAVTDVRHYLKNYEKDQLGALITDTNGQYIVSSINTNLGKVARPYTLRLITHTDDSEQSVLLQRVYYGLGAGSNIVATTQEDLLLPGFLASARRISAAHLPWSDGNAPWVFSGELKDGTNATAVVTVGHDDQAGNPFLHTYHPDHDNLNATFDAPMDRGYESYLIKRTIGLFVLAPGEDFDALTAGSDTLAGRYEEEIEIQAVGTEKRNFDVMGVFQLKKLSDVATLTQ